MVHIIERSVVSHCNKFMFLFHSIDSIEYSQNWPSCWNLIVYPNKEDEYSYITDLKLALFKKNFKCSSSDSNDISVIVIFQSETRLDDSSYFTHIEYADRNITSFLFSSNGIRTVVRWLYSSCQSDTWPWPIRLVDVVVILALAVLCYRIVRLELFFTFWTNHFIFWTHYFIPLEYKLQTSSTDVDGFRGNKLCFCVLRFRNI